MYYKRSIDKIARRYGKFPVVAILGPRQSGKTTLAKHAYKNHTFLDLEDLELRTLAQSDPKAFLRRYENEHGLILDEFQNVPELLSYIKVIVDEKKRPGYFVLTGSQNFLINERVSQSLAGRVGILTLLPLSIAELRANGLLDPNKPEKTIFTGCYPRIYAEHFESHEFFPSYIHTYAERDVRQLINVSNLLMFRKFMKLCAARVGQLINFSELAAHCGMSVATIHQWLSILESSYIIFLLQPHWNNFNKRITKTPKIYFYDTGLVCSLLGIDSESDLLINSFYGNLFENLIVSDLFKQYFNTGKQPNLYFWRDRNGEIEVDCLATIHAKLVPIEIKSAETYREDLLRPLLKWNKLAGRFNEKSYLVYGGTQVFQGSNNIDLVSWTNAGTIIE